MTGHTSTNVTVDDCSPLIDYQPEGVWFQKSDEADPEDLQYYGGSFTFTESMGATASFSFNGTSLAIYGANWVDIGNYSVNLDGTTYPGNPFTTSPEEPRPLLFKAPPLRQGNHVVVIQNTGYSRLDIDQIVWTSDIENSGGEKSHEDKVDDTHEDFQYHPVEAWWPQSNLSNFMSSTSHTTSTFKASVTYSFSGNSISLFGTTGPNNSPYTVQLDEWPNKTFQGNKSLYKAQSLLYYADNLGPGNHTLTVTNEANSKLQIDYASISKLSVSRSQPPIPDPTGESTNEGKGLNAGQIAGLAVGGSIIIILFMSLCFLARRNRTLWHRLQRGYMVQSQFDSTAPSIESGWTVASSRKSSKYGSEHIAQGYQHEHGHSHSMSEAPVHRPPVLRPLSLVSRLSSSASTLVAENGSTVGERRSRRTKRTIRRDVENTASTIRSPLSPTDNELIPSTGHQFAIGLSPNQSQLDIRVIVPEGRSIDGSLVMPPRSLATTGRSSPRLESYDRTRMDTPIQRERSPSPVRALSPATGETGRLLESSSHTSPSDSTDFLTLAGRTPGHNHRPRINEDYTSLTGRYI